MDQLNWFQSWCVKHNPGWSLDIDLAETPLEDLERANRLDERDENDWIAYEVKNSKFIGHCGPENLGELIPKPEASS